MSDSSPYFFFSYARGDEDSYLKRFFEDLRWRVSQLSGVAEVDTVGFRDSHGINTGDDWNTKISTALHASKVLVCIYTAKFFGREYCGKEFAAFLKRNGEFRYERIRDADGQIKYRIREARNIIPILWVGEGDLALHPDPKKKLPPYALRTIQYFTQSLPSRVVKEYQANGLRRMYVKRPSVTRDDVIRHFATAIVSAQPLPSLDRPHTFEELWDAFWDIPEEHEAQDGAAEVAVTEPVVAAPDAVAPGPGHILAIEVNLSAEPAAWVPYAGGPTLATAVREIAHHLQEIRHFSYLALDPGASDFEARAWAAVEDATSKLATPILFINPRCLDNEQPRSALVSLLQRKWCGGIIVPADRSDEEAIRLIRDNLPALTPPEIANSRIVVRSSIGTIDQFQTAVGSVVMEIRGKIAEVGPVQQRPSPNDGPDARPRITNFLHAKPQLPSPEAPPRWLS